MGIQIEFNPDLALRAHSEFKKGNRLEQECLPKLLEEGRTYKFLKTGQRNYWLGGVIPLVQTEGGGRLSKPLAAIRIIEATHFIDHTDKIDTKGEYKVVEVFDSSDNSGYFKGLEYYTRRTGAPEFDQKYIDE